MKQYIMKMSSILTVIFFAMLSSDSMAQKITKCQDKDGKWHYGSNNSYRCDNSSKITTLNDRGMKVDEEAPVKTAEQLEKERLAAEEEKKRIEKETFDQAERDRILMVYQSQDDIQRSRENELRSLEQKKGQHQNYILALEKKKDSLEKKKAGTKNKGIIKRTNAQIAPILPKIEKSNQKIVEIDQKIIEVNKKYDADLAFFKKHKGDK